MKPQLVNEKIYRRDVMKHQVNHPSDAIGEDMHHDLKDKIKKA
jgi:hypothetical protein